MRIQQDDPEARYWEVYLDGQHVRRGLLADDERGLVIVEAESREEMEPGEPGEPAGRRLYGKVEFRVSMKQVMAIDRSLRRERDQARETARTLLEIAETALHHGNGDPALIPRQVTAARHLVKTWQETKREDQGQGQQTRNHYRLLSVKRDNDGEHVRFSLIIDRAERADLCLDTETFNDLVADLGLRLTSPAATEYESTPLRRTTEEQE